MGRKRNPWSQRSQKLHKHVGHYVNQIALVMEELDSLDKGNVKSLRSRAINILATLGGSGYMIVPKPKTNIRKGKDIE